MPVLSRKIYQPSEFVEIMTGKYFEFPKENTFREIEDIFDWDFGEDAIQSYDLSEIEMVVYNHIPCVLVDVSGFYNHDKIIPMYRWYQVSQYLHAFFINDK